MHASGSALQTRIKDMSSFERGNSGLFSCTYKGDFGSGDSCYLFVFVCALVVFVWIFCTSESSRDVLYDIAHCV